jgi:hypothetical protein
LLAVSGHTNRGFWNRDDIGSEFLACVAVRNVNQRAAESAIGIEAEKITEGYVADIILIENFWIKRIERLQARTQVGAPGGCDFFQPGRVRCSLVSGCSERKDIERFDVRIRARGHAGGDEYGLIAERCDLALVISHESALVGVGLAAAVDGDDQIILGQAEGEIGAVAEIG